MSYSWDYFVQEAATFREVMGSRAVMLNPLARENALKAFVHVGTRCSDPRATVALQAHILDYSARCRWIDDPHRAEFEKAGAYGGHSHA